MATLADYYKKAKSAFSSVANRAIPGFGTAQNVYRAARSYKPGNTLADTVKSYARSKAQERQDFKETTQPVVNFAKDAARALPRAVVSGGLSLSQGANGIDPNSVGAKEFDYTPNNTASRLVFGSEPIRTVQNRSISNAETLRNMGVNPTSAGFLGGVGAFAATALDLTPLPGKKKAVEVAGKQILKRAMRPNPAETRALVEFTDVINGAIKADPLTQGTIAQRGSQVLRKLGVVPSNDPVQLTEQVHSVLNGVDTVKPFSRPSGAGIPDTELAGVAKAPQRPVMSSGRVQFRTSNGVQPNVDPDVLHEVVRNSPVVTTAEQARMADEVFYGSRKNMSGRALSTPSAQFGKDMPELVSDVAKRKGVEPPFGSLDDAAKVLDATPVKNKTGLLDYLRTPDRVLKKFGLGNEAENLVKAQRSYQVELPKEINRITEWAGRVPGAQSSQAIFKHLDGEKVTLTPQEMQVANEIKQYLSGWADKLDLPQDKRVSNYITHIFEKDMIEKEFPEELAKIIADKVPGSVYDPFTEQRLGKQGYIEDVWRALDAYVKRGTRKVHMDPVLETVSKKANSLEESQLKYLKAYIDRVNMRPTELDNLLDNSIKQVVGYKFGQRPTASLSRTGRRMIYRGTLGLNAGSALRNLSQAANTYSELGEKYTAIGYTNIIKNWNSDELKRVGVLADDFIQDRVLTSTKQAAEKMDNVLFSMFNFAEKVNRGAAYYGAKAKFLKQGMTEGQAVEGALNLVRKTQFTFGAVDTPAVLQSDITKTLLQFSSYPIKQSEFLLEKIGAKDWAGVARYTGATLVFAYTVGQALGMDWKSIFPSFRLGTPPSLSAPVTAVKTLMGGKDKYGKPLDWKDVAAETVKYIPGGVQAKKSYEGINAFIEGASLTPSGNERFKVEQTPKNLLKAGVFGQYSVPEAREYFAEKKGEAGNVISNLFSTKKAEAKKASEYSEKEVKKFKRQIEGGEELEASQYVAALDLEKKLKNDGKVSLVKSVLESDSIPQAQRATVLSELGLNVKKEVEAYFTKKNKPLVSAQISLGMDRAKRAENHKEWIRLAEQKVDYLKKFQGTTEDLEDQISTQNSIEDLEEQIAKYSGYGGFTKPKKPKKGRQASASVSKTPTFSTSRPTIRRKRVR